LASTVDRVRLRLVFNFSLRRLGLGSLASSASSSFSSSASASELLVEHLVVLRLFLFKPGVAGQPVPNPSGTWDMPETFETCDMLDAWMLGALLTAARAPTARRAPAEPREIR
jgi:hypothetical protein